MTVVALALAPMAIPASAQAAPAAAGGVDDYSCTPSAAHPNPIVLLHGTFATASNDLNYLQSDLAGRGYCTFSLTYGAYDGFPQVGGLKPVAESAVQIKAFIGQVRAATGAAKVDLVGHSEGGLQTLYVTKVQRAADQIGRVIAIAPPTHGTSAAGVLTLGEALLGRATLDTVFAGVGAPVLSDEAPGGPAILALNNGPIAQPGVKYTVIASRFDEVVTPAGTSSFVYEPGVTNQYVQDFCPFDPVGHIGEAYDLNVWHLVRNALDPANATPIAVCSAGSPG